MYKLSRLAGVLGIAAVIALAGCAGSSGVAPSTGSAMTVQHQNFTPYESGWIHKDGVVYRKPIYMVTRNMAQPAVSGILFSYGGGPVLVAPKMYLIFWGFRKYGDPDRVARLLKLYAKNLGGSGHNNIYTQYYEEVTGTTKTYITNPTNQFGGFWYDWHSIPTSPSDSQVAAQALLGVKHFGYDPNGSYVVVTATGHNSPGFGTSYCAYHDVTSYTGGKLVSYTNLPYQPDALASCGANIITPPADEKGIDEGVTIVEGHEYGESITDPGAGNGWYNGEYGEIGDACAWTDILNDPFTLKSYTSQPMYSNASESCVHSY
jgi:serine protease